MVAVYVNGMPVDDYSKEKDLEQFVRGAVPDYHNTVYNHKQSLYHVPVGNKITPRAERRGKVVCIKQDGENQKFNN